LNRSESKYFNTAEKMNDALLRLLEKKDFEYITIKELCEEAKVNRSTFYLHYENVGDLLEETTRRLLDRFLSYFTVELENINSGFADCEPGKLNFITEEYMKPYLSYIRDYRSTFSVALKNNHTFGFEQIYDRMFDNIFNPILERFGYPEEHRKFVMMFYLNGINAVVNQWLAEECRQPAEEISAVITECVFGRNEGYKILNYL